MSGAKNSALPVLAACLLTAERVSLDRIPQVRDIRTMEKLLSTYGRAGGAPQRPGDGGGAQISTHPEAPYEVVKTMRASSLVLGPLVARCGRARVSLPGGCAIGARPINLHVAGLERLGARVRQEHGYIEAEAPNGLKARRCHFDRITVTGTEDLLMAAVLARGETIINNAAREPEVADLADLLIKMGARSKAPEPRPFACTAWTAARRGRALDHRRPDRGRHVSGRGRDHRRRSDGDRLRAGASARADRQTASGGRRSDRDRASRRRAAGIAGPVEES